MQDCRLGSLGQILVLGGRKHIQRRHVPNALEVPKIAKSKDFSGISIPPKIIE